MTQTPSSKSITWDVAEETLENIKKTIGPEMTDSVTALHTYQNCLVSWLNIQLGALAEEFDTRETRFLAKAGEALWGDLYQIDESDEESARMEALAEFFGHIQKESENVWLTLTLTVALVRFSLQAGVYMAGQAAESGSSNALKALAHYKSNLASFSDIADGIMAEVDS